MQDSELLMQFRDPATKEKAYTAIIRKYQERLYWHIRRMVVEHEDANDVLQNVFIRVWNGLENFREDSQLYTWLYRIATNELNQYYRKQKYQPQSLQQLLENPHMEKLLHQQQDNEREMIERELQQHEDYNQIRVNLLKLDIKYQEVIALRYFEQKTNVEISLILGKNEGTVKSLLSRGLEKLRNML